MIKLRLCCVFSILIGDLIAQVTVIAGNDTSYHTSLYNAYNDENSVYKTNRNENWQVLIDNRKIPYSGEGWKNIYWGSSPVAPYFVIIRPKSPDSKVLIKGDSTDENCLRIARCKNVIIENIHFIGFFRYQLSVLKSENCVVQNCTFSDITRENAWCAIEVEYSNRCIFKNNQIYNLDSPGIALHAFYLKHSNENQIIENGINYCSGAVFKCVLGSHHNIFDGNVISGGCGDYAYFVGRNPYDVNKKVMDTPAYGNIVINTITTGPPPSERLRVYKNNSIIRRFVYSALPDSFPEYTYPNRIDDRFDSTKVFYMPKTGHGNHFVTVNNQINVVIDSIIDSTPASIRFEQPIYRAQYDIVDHGAKLAITENYIESGFHRYLKEIVIDDTLNSSINTPFEYRLLTTEGDMIKKGEFLIIKNR